MEERLAARVPGELVLRVRAEADELGRSVSWVVRLALERYFDSVDSSDYAARAAMRGVALPKVVEPGPWREGVLEGRGGKTDVRPAVRVPTEDGAKLVDQGTGEVVAVEKGRPRKAPGRRHRDKTLPSGAVKCQDCTLIANAARPEVCDG